MLNYALTFLVVSLVSGILGFWGLSNVSADIAKICFFAFLILFVVSLVSGGMRRRGPNLPV